MSVVREIQILAATDPVAACARFAVVAQRCPPEEIAQLAALAVHVHARIGRVRDGLAVIARIMAMPMVAEPALLRSLARAKAALLRLAGEREAADTVVGEACVEPGDRPRLDALTAQAAQLAGRTAEAESWLAQAAQGLTGLPATDATREQVAGVARAVATAALASIQQHVSVAQMAAACECQAIALHHDAGKRHASIHHAGVVHLRSGRPDRALRSVEELLSLEAANALSVTAQVQTMMLAVRAQLQRGMPRLAAAARMAIARVVANGNASERAALANQLLELDQVLATPA